MDDPMSFKRFVHRNCLAKGGYYDAGSHKHRFTHPDVLNQVTKEELLQAIERYQLAFALLLGDLRRLEVDSVDETACALIAVRTGLNADVVSAVLKEYVSW